MPWDDDDDWVGEPPEGHHSRDRARPDFWRTQHAPELVAAAVLVAIVVLVVVLIVH